MKLYIIRHGQTTWNVGGRMQGSKNSNLTDIGKLNATKLGESLKDTNIDYIYTSPLTRAYDTAMLIKGDRDIPIEIHKNLKEMSFGIWEGMYSEDVIRDYKEEHYNFWNVPHEYTPNGGESFEELIKRVENTLNYILSQNKGENILISTHTIVIKAIYAILKNYEIEDFWNPPYIKNTCLTIIDYKDGEYIFELEADVSHKGN